MAWLALGSWAWLACASSLPGEAESDVWETGRACAPATTRCDAVSCTADIQNGCETPVTCRLHVWTLCRTTTGSEGPATAASQKLTILRDRENSLVATVSCGEGAPSATRIDRLECM